MQMEKSICRPEKEQEGFTLLEILFVLSAFALLFLLIPPLPIGKYESFQEKQFLDTLRMDVLYIQSHSNKSPENNLFIRFYEKRYEIRSGHNTLIEVRPYLPDMTLDTRGNNVLSFNENGTFLSPRTIRMDTGSKQYEIVFPFGKGRFHTNEK